MQLTTIDINHPSFESQIAITTNEQLLGLLSDTLMVTAKYIQILAKVWRELENRGVDLNHLRSGIAYYLPMIADDKIDASVVLAFAGQQLLLREISLMPIDLQKKLANGELVKVVEYKKETKTFTTKTLPLKQISTRLYPQLFDMGRLLSEQEQMAFLQRKAAKTKQKNTAKLQGTPIKRKSVSYNASKDAFSFGNTGVVFDDIIKALALKYSKDKDQIKSALSSL